MAKSEVYSWRVSPDVKRDLEDSARREGLTIGGLLDRIVGLWLRTSRGAGDDEAEQRRLHEAARAVVGTIDGRAPRRAEEARDRVRRRLAGRRAG